MRLLRFVAFLSCVCAVLPALAQTSQSQSSQNSGTPRQESPQGSGAGFVRNPFEQQPALSSIDTLTTESQAKEALKHYLAQRRRGIPFVIPDQGIFTKSDSNICGAIVSYNFSQGASPHLENITTCTPSKGFATRYVDGDGHKPAGLGVVHTNLVLSK